MFPSIDKNSSVAVTQSVDTGTKRVADAPPSSSSVGVSKGPLAQSETPLSQLGRPPAGSVERQESATSLRHHNENSREALLKFHRAIASRDVGAVKALKAEGLRPIHLDDQRRYPLQLLDSQASHENQALRNALLQSRNPTAPANYVKPEAFHGTSWGLEILSTGALKGGVNDPKGGESSLEGKVFFSDRTPVSEQHDFTRPDLRRKARVYSAGSGWRSSSPSLRAMQHRLTQGMLHPAAEECPLNLTDAGAVVEIAGADQVEQVLKELLQESLTKKFPTRVAATPLSGLTAETILPQTVVLKLNGKIFEMLGGKDLDVAFRRAALGLKDSLESGKAPYLALLNGGRVVPMVLGFEKIPDLKTHVIHQGSKGDAAFSYKDRDHPLSGEAGMGGLKEIELTGLADLATLCLGAYLKGIDLPVDIVIRLKARGRDPASATYMAPEQLREFQAMLQRSVQTYWDGHRVASEGVSADVASWPIHQLQQLNKHVRELGLGMAAMMSIE